MACLPCADARRSSPNRVQLVEGSRAPSRPWRPSREPLIVVAPWPATYRGPPLGPSAFQHPHRSSRIRLRCPKEPLSKRHFDECGIAEGVCEFREKLSPNPSSRASRGRLACGRAVLAIATAGEHRAAANACSRGHPATLRGLGVTRRVF
jgi:hypothetical protein